MTDLELLAKADHLARMICKMLRDDIKGDSVNLFHGERRRLAQLAHDWLEAYHNYRRP